jgi:hypothetical protein
MENSIMKPKSPPIFKIARSKIPITDDELRAEYRAFKDETLDEEDDGVSSTPEGELYWRLTHGEEGKNSENSFLLDIDSMIMGRLYPVKLGGVKLDAVKDEDGSVSFYSRP